MGGGTGRLPSSTRLSPSPPLSLDGPWLSMSRCLAGAERGRGHVPTCVCSDTLASPGPPQDEGHICRTPPTQELDCGSPSARGPQASGPDLGQRGSQDHLLLRTGSGQRCGQTPPPRLHPSRWEGLGGTCVGD